MEPILKILVWNIIDAEFDIGVSINAELIECSNSDVLSCMDISIATPIITVSVSGDDSITTLINMIGILGEWFIVNAENAWFRKSLHYEWYTDITEGFVDECTYKQREKALLSSDPPYNYFTYFISAFIDKGDYYEVTGKLFDTACIPAKIADGMIA